MSDEQIESMVESYFLKSRITDFILCIILIFIAVPIIYFLYSLENLSMAVMILAFFVFYNILFGLLNMIVVPIRKKKFSLILDVLENECDFIAFKKLIECGYRGYYSPAYARNTIINSYFRICNLERDSKKIKELLNDKVFKKFNKRNVIYLEFLKLTIAECDKNDEQVELSYQYLIDKLNQKNNKKNEKLKKDLDIIYSSYKKEYKFTLMLLDSIETKTNASRVINASNKAICLYELKRNDEAIEQLNYVIEYGNTLPQVERAKELLLEISE